MQSLYAKWELRITGNLKNTDIGENLAEHFLSEYEKHEDDEWDSIIQKWSSVQEGIPGEFETK